MDLILLKDCEKKEREKEEEEEGMQQRLYDNQSLKYLLPGFLQRRCIERRQTFRVHAFARAIPSAWNALSWLSLAFSELYSS